MQEIPISSLANDRFIGVAEDVVPGRCAWISGLCAKAGFKPNFAAKTSDISETFTRIAADNAVTLLPDYLSGNPPPGTAYCRLTDKWATWKLSVLRQRGSGLKAARTLVELIVAKKYFDGYMPNPQPLA